MLKDISEYVYDGSSLVLKKTRSISKYVYGLVFAAMFFLVVPAKYMPVEVSYQKQQEVPEEVVQENHTEKAINYILKINPKVSEDDAYEIVKSAFIYGTRFGVDPATLLAIAKVESTFDKHAISGVGAMGILQVMPRWHHDKFKAAKKELGNPEVFAIETNFFVGAQIYKECAKKFSSTKNVLLCYNGSVGDPSAEYHKLVLDAKNEIKPLLKGVRI